YASVGTSKNANGCMILGAHASVAGGLCRAFARADADTSQAVQIFTSSSRRWARPTLPRAEVAAFRRELAARKWPALAHASYLINLGTADRALRKRSRDALVAELCDAEALGLSAVVLHPGSHVGSDCATGLARAAEALSQVLARLHGAKVQLLLELTAG